MDKIHWINSMSKTSHDHLFKELLGEFFPEFIDLFFPQVSLFLGRNSIEFLPLELFANLTEGDTFETDLIVKAKFKDQDAFLLSTLSTRLFFTRILTDGFSIIFRCSIGITDCPFIRSSCSPTIARKKMAIGVT